MEQLVMCFEEPERWLPIPDWEDLYEVSDEGRVRSLPRIDRLGRRFKGRVLKVSQSKDGRLHIVLSGDGRKHQTRRISVLVALAFLGPRPADMDVCHNDGDHSNNRLSNLRYDTASGNMLDTLIHGTNHYRNKTHCPQGHEYTEENTIYFGTKGHRRCRTCTKERERRRLLGVRHSLLTADQVREIRLRAASGARPKDLASEFGVRRDQIYRIISRHSWANVA